MNEKTLIAEDGEEMARAVLGATSVTVSSKKRAVHTRCFRAGLCFCVLIRFTFYNLTEINVEQEYFLKLTKI